jgi:nucleotide-binding universal stress UspA family protein
MAQLLNSEVVLMRAVDDPLERTGAEAQTYLDDVVTRVSAGNIRAVSRVVAGSPASAIQEVANEVGINLIAMATHGRTGVARVALGSVATRTLQRATVPMLLVHPKTVGAAVEHDTQATASRTTR